MSKQDKDVQVLTEIMDIGTNDFDKFQAILLMKAKERSGEQKKKIELMALRFKMEDYLNSKDKHSRLVGDFIVEYLNTFKIKQYKFAHYIGMRPSNLSKLIKGERSLNHELALILGKIFENDPLLWLEIQNKNRLNELPETKKNRIKRYSLEDLLNE